MQENEERAKHNWQLTDQYVVVDWKKYPIFHCDQCDCDITVHQYWEESWDDAWCWYNWIHSDHYDEMPDYCDKAGIARHRELVKRVSFGSFVRKRGYLYDQEEFNEALQNLCDIVVENKDAMAQ